MTKTISSKQQYGVLDIVKFIMAILVVTIHRRIGDESDFWVFEELNVLASLAVPFFFASSSYLFFSKINRVNDKTGALEAYAFRLLRLFAIWTALYIPSNIYRYKLFQKWTWAETLSEILKFSSHLWFLPALVLSVVFIYYSTRRNPKVTGIIAFVLLGFSILAGLNRFYVNNSTLIVRILFAGIPYVYLGYYIANRSKPVDKKKAIVLFILFLALSFAEGFIEFRYLSNTFFASSRICYFPTIYFLLMICLNIKTKERKIYITLRKLSMFIYFIHVIIYQEMLWLILHIFGLGDLYNYTLVRFGMTIAYISIACIALLFLENKKGFRWLKKLYN